MVDRMADSKAAKTAERWVVVMEMNWVDWWETRLAAKSVVWKAGQWVD